MDRDYQIINDERWPLFPFWIKNTETGMAMEVHKYDEGKDAFSNNYVRSPFKESVLISVSEIEHDRTVPKPEKKYRPWTVTDVKNIRFFNGMIFNRKCRDVQSVVTRVSPKDCRSTIFVDRWVSYLELFEEYEYSYDCETWMPCGEEITE